MKHSYYYSAPIEYGDAQRRYLRRYDSSAEAEGYLARLQRLVARCERGGKYVDAGVPMTLDDIAAELNGGRKSKRVRGYVDAAVACGVLVQDAAGTWWHPEWMQLQQPAYLRRMADDSASLQNVEDSAWADVCRKATATHKQSPDEASWRSKWRAKAAVERAGLDSRWDIRHWDNWWSQRKLEYNGLLSVQQAEDDYVPALLAAPPSIPKQRGRPRTRAVDVSAADWEDEPSTANIISTADAASMLEAGEE